MSRDGKSRLFVALDVATRSEAKRLVDLLAPAGCNFKIGLEAYTACGPDIVKDVGPERVFLDLKFHDIPNTVAGAARAATRLSVWMFNVHAAGGSAMMRAAVEAARAESRVMERTPPRILGVTVLTSIDQATLNKDLGIAGAVESQVERLARLVREAGLDGVVCSPQEARIVREACGPDFIIVTPGVRPAGAGASDQARVTTPADAIRAGADYIVMGRPITGAKDPAAVAREMMEEIARA